jgi:hypothetical protein
MSYCENFRIDGKRINELEIKEGECVKFNSLQYQKSTSEIIELSSSPTVSKKDGFYKVRCKLFEIYLFNDKGRLINDMKYDLYINKSGIDFGKSRNRGTWKIIFGPGNVSNELNEGVSLDNCISRFITYNSGYKITEYYFNKSEKIREVHVDSDQIIDIWNPKDIKLEIPNIMKYIFLHIYFLLKIIMGNKINNKDLRQYIFDFLFDL